MLLAGDADGEDVCVGGLGERLLDCDDERIDPPLRFLLAGSVAALDERVGRVAAAESLAGGVDQESLGALCSAVNS